MDLNQLSYLGNTDLAAEVQKNISIVGARKTSALGLAICKELVKALSKYNCHIVSGLAYGIDSCAHQSALDYGLKTIAVLGCGLDHFPQETGNPALARTIIAGKDNLIVSQFQADTPANKSTFPQRNKIIAALSQCTIVIEASINSGSLITADFALELGKKLYTIPGQFNNKNFAGNNYLLANNLAQPILDFDRFCDELGLDEKQHQTQTILDQETKRILDCFELEPLNIEAIISRLDMDYAKLSRQLTLLELQGLIRRQPGMRFVKI